MNRIQRLQEQINDLEKRHSNHRNRIKQLENPAKFNIGDEVIVGYKGWRDLIGYDKPDFDHNEAYSGVIIKRAYWNGDGGWDYELWVEKDKVVVTGIYEEIMKLKT